VRRVQGADGIRAAAAALREGGLAAFPTETVYGLGADARRVAAVARIFAAKGRPADNPLIVHVPDLDRARALAATWPAMAEGLARRFWPGPLTLVVPARGDIARSARAGLDTVGIRCPDHALALSLLEAADVPVAAPSANRSGRPSPTTADAVLDDLADVEGLVLDGGPTGIGVESTVLDVSGPAAVLLRPGGLGREAIEEEVGPVLLPEGTGVPRAPGMKYRHYAPSLPVTLLRLPEAEAVREIRRSFDPRTTGVLAPTGVRAALDEFRGVDLGEDAESAAARLFSGLRRLESEPGLSRIVAVWRDTRGRGLAVMNRLEKAAGEGEHG
jgi:L-threonylcarbamoyladenylate synthase